jgi:hypothetical protein
VTIKDNAIVCGLRSRVPRCTIGLRGSYVTGFQDLRRRLGNFCPTSSP